MKLATGFNWMKKVVIAFAAIAMVWQCAFVTAAFAAPAPLLATDFANQVKGAADDVRDASKDLIRDTKKNVKKTADRNASKVEEADDSGSFAERKALRDQGRIEERAENHAARTEKAVDDSMNAVQGAVEKIKDAFGG
jgi:hypothetical protein